MQAIPSNTYACLLLMCVHTYVIFDKNTPAHIPTSPSTLPPALLSLPWHLSAACIMVFYGLSEVARELEDPFNCTPNELPLGYLHGRLNRMLLDLVLVFILPRSRAACH